MQSNSRQIFIQSVVNRYLFFLSFPFLVSLRSTGCISTPRFLGVLYRSLLQASVISLWEEAKEMKDKEKDGF